MTIGRSVLSAAIDNIFGRILRLGAAFAAGLWHLRRDGLLAWLLNGLLGCFLTCRLEQAQQFAVHGVVAGGDLPLGQDGVFAVAVADEAAGFAHQNYPGGDIPRRQVALPIGIEPAGGDPGEIEGRRAVTAQTGETLLRGCDLVARQRQIAAAAVMRQAAGDNRVGQVLARRDPDALVVEIRALAALGDEQLLIGRIVGQAGDDDAVALERDRHREMRDAVQEIGGAVERSDGPTMALVGAGPGPTFLAEKAVGRPRLGQFLIDDLLGAAVGGGDEIARPLERHLQMLDLAEIALEAAPGAARGLDHDVEDSGMQHGGPAPVAALWRNLFPPPYLPPPARGGEGDHPAK